MDLAARTIGDGLFQKLQKLTCRKTSDVLSSVSAAEIFGYRCCLCLTEVWKETAFTGNETLHLLCGWGTGR